MAEAVRPQGDICRAGGLSDVGDDQSIVPGDVGKVDPAIGDDFISTEIMADFITLEAPGAIVNLLDELARTQVPLDHVSIQ
jgi:hypothetical protein